MSRTTFYDRNYIGYPPVHIRDYTNPESRHWKHQFDGEKYRFLQSLKEWHGEEYAEKYLKAWIEELYPDDEFPTWREMYDDLRILHEHYPECGCLPNSLTVCRLCRVTASALNS